MWKVQRSEVARAWNEVVQRESRLAVLYITHDLATARHFSDDILVLHHGRVVERGPADAVILDPHHDYTKLLALSAPDPNRVGGVVRSVAPDRDAIDDSVCYDHHLGDWVPTGVRGVAA